MKRVAGGADSLILVYALSASLLSGSCSKAGPVPVSGAPAEIAWSEKLLALDSADTAPPIQKNLSMPIDLSAGSFQVRALAEYQLQARILASERNDREWSPIDMGLGWGEAAKRDVLKANVRFSISNGFATMMSRGVSESQWSQNHLLPMDEGVFRKLISYRPGSIVRMRGYLVEMKNHERVLPTSLTRDDSGGLACERILVMDAELMSYDGQAVPPPVRFWNFLGF
jgi:hypothetical protein